MRRALTAASTLIAVLVLAAPASAQTPTNAIVISEFRVRGPVGGNDEFVELRNRSAAQVVIAGYRLAGCAAATGLVSNRATVPAGVTLAAGQAYLFVNNNAGGGYSGPVAGDQTYGTGFTDFEAANQSGIRVLDASDAIVDGVGSPNSPCREGTGFTTPTANGDQSFERLGGTTDTDNNVPDFTGPKPGSPQNRAGTEPPPPGDQAPRVTATTPTQGQDNVPRESNVTITFSEPVTATAGAFSFTCNGTAVPFTLTASPDGTTFVLDPDGQLPASAVCTVTVEADAVSDQDTDDPPDNPTADFTLTFSTVEASVEGLRIHDIQGRQHLSPYRGTLVAGVPGVITAVRNNGFYLQDPLPDADERTSEGIFVFTVGAPAPNLQPNVAITVGGRVTEFRGGGASSANLTITEIIGPVVTITGTGTIPPTIVGQGGRRPPTSVIDNDTPDPQTDDPPLVTGDVESKSSAGPENQDPTFDPRQDGIDFYESLEGMLTQVNQAQAVQPTNDFGEIPVLADRGAGATNRTPRWSIVARAVDFTLPQDYRFGDFNPERIFLDDEIARLAPIVDTGDTLSAPVRAVVDYSFGNFKFEVLDWPPARDGGLRPETTDRQDRDDLSVASYNVENLDPGDGPRFERIAAQIVDNLRAPDVVTVIEAQDNNGPAPGDSNADLTFTRLVQAIDAVGPTYDYRQIDPVPNQDGGEPNGNIRVGFLFRPDRIQFVDRPGGTAVTATEDDPAQPGAQLTFSPGRIEPTNPVWQNSRKPLAGEFRFRGETVFIVGNHFNSKGGDERLFGRFQEPRRPSEVQRRGGTQPDRPDRGQAGVVNAWVERLQQADPRASIVVMGDFNDFDFSETLRVLERGREDSRRVELVNLWRLLPERERYSYIFEGNAQTLDHILVSPSVLREDPEIDGVHINAEFFDQVSDHDPVLARLSFDGGDDDDDDDDDGDDD